MAQYFPFQPTPISPATFIATFDGAQYTCVITWSLFGLRYYLNVYDQTGTRILTKAAVVSMGSSITNLLAGYFKSVMYLDQVARQFVVTP